MSLCFFDYLKKPLDPTTPLECCGGLRKLSAISSLKLEGDLMSGDLTPPG